MVGSKANCALIQELKKWSSEGEKQRRKINLWRESQDPENGKTSLTFLHEAGQQEFIVHCPVHYPEYNVEEDNFYVEAHSSLQLWCNALNEFVLDTDSRLTLTAILNKGLSLYSSADEAAATTSNSDNYKVTHSDTGNSKDVDDFIDVVSSSSDDRIDTDSNDEDEENQALSYDKEFEDAVQAYYTKELEISKRKKRWKSKENELRAKGSQCYSDIIKVPLFSSAAASAILTNDLVQIMETSGSTGIAADTIDDNIFQWNIKMSQFDKDCSLNKDFEEMVKDHGYNYLELQLDFSMDLYPFFPPVVKVIRPRLQGSMMLRVTTMEILKLSYWNPARDMKSVLEEIKSFLQTWARLDLLSVRNDRTRFQEGAYLDAEYPLPHLFQVNEMAPGADKPIIATEEAERRNKENVSTQSAIGSNAYSYWDEFLNTVRAFIPYFSPQNLHEHNRENLRTNNFFSSIP